ncbi:hypothetical protein EON65_54545 [archaeon]|nr:MAG: hypothetical protein EON65_54545 [archaeon]
MFRKVMDKMMQKDLEARAHRHYEDTKNVLYVDLVMNKTIIFDIKRWNRDDNKYPDDQYAINQVLKDMGIKWPANMSKTLVAESHTGQLSWHDRTVSITLLHEQAFMRNCANNRMNQRYVKFRPPSKVLHQYIFKKVEKATMAHCFLSPHATGDFEKKKHYLVYYSLWRLPYDAKMSSEFVFIDFQKYSDRYDYNETDIGYVPKRRGPQTATTSSVPQSRQIGQGGYSSHRRPRKERAMN